MNYQICIDKIKPKFHIKIMTFPQISPQNSQNKLEFTVLQNISGADSQVEIIETRQTKLVLKTFIQRKLNQKKLNPVAKRN